MENKKTITVTKDDLPADIDIEVLVAESGMIIKIEDGHGFPIGYQFLHHTFHEFLVAINLFINNIRDYPSFSIVTMLVGLYSACVGSSKSQRITKEIVQVLSNKVEVKTFEEIINTIKTLRLSFDDIAYFVYEHQADSFELPCLYFSYFRHDKYSVQARKYFLNLCKEKKVKIETFNQSTELNGYVEILYCCQTACFEYPENVVTVSYTHLTLPTICSV